jgi:malate dehydrogenase (quinone)
MENYDVVIIGGGVSGTALLYVLSNYTNIKRIALFEKYDNVAQVNSNTQNNSQTLHFGDIETNYTFEKAAKVKRAADMVKNYVERYDENGRTFSKYHKMVLAVGNEQVEKLEKRYEEFKELFPELRKIYRDEIAKIEPNVVEGRDKDEKIMALFSENGYTMDFQKLSESFLDKSVDKNGEVDVFLGNKVSKIEKDNDRFKIYVDDKVVGAKFVAVCAGAHSLLFAKSLGYGTEYALLSVAGSFYLAPKSLNGKVYTTQIKKLPFAAIHGDPEVHDRSVTRFGPTAKALLMLERHKYSTVWDYFRTAGLSVSSFIALGKILSDWVVFKYLLKNFMYDIPIIGKRLFIKEVRKIVPNVKLSDLEFAKGYGGVRPQIVDITNKKLNLGEAKILGDNILFNITPSPGASTCLRNAEEDTEKIVGYLGEGYWFDKEGFEGDLENN